MKKPLLSVVNLACLMAVSLPGAATASEATVSAAETTERPDPVVVATLDTGLNPFHPCFRRDWDEYRGEGDEVVTPRDFIPNYPEESVELPLTMGDTYEGSLTASQPVLDAIERETLYHVPDTNISFIGFGDLASEQLTDNKPHGAMAASQIACERYGMGSNAHLVVLNYEELSKPLDLMPESGPPPSTDDLIRWAAAQTWIDVVHLNIADLVPLPTEAEAVKTLIASGKMVVVAAGNGPGNCCVGAPSELDKFPGPPGALVAGANDNGGWALYSNLNPDVVMDGNATLAAASDSYGERGFNGTSSASPRITGYVAQVLGRLRATFGHTWEGLLTIPPNEPRPATGPLHDGSLSAAELHEVIRKTAYPNPHESRYDGGEHHLFLVPQPAELPFAWYPKMGYGEISEHTIDLALQVLAGEAPMPERPYEDSFFGLSRAIREQLWTLPGPWGLSNEVLSRLNALDDEISMQLNKLTAQLLKELNELSLPTTDELAAELEELINNLPWDELDEIQEQLPPPLNDVPKVSESVWRSPSPSPSPTS